MRPIRSASSFVTSPELPIVPVAPVRNALTVDVEDYFHVGAFQKVIRPEDWGGFESRVVRNTVRLLDLFDRHRVKGTFFVLGWVAQREPELVREVTRRGHEIACHGETHELVFKQSPAVFLSETQTAKRRLEDTTGLPVLGYRAASYSVTRDSIWALQILEDLGFMYDSSVFPIHHDVYGIPGSPRYRHAVASGKLQELPLTTVEVAGTRLPCAGGGYFRLLPYAYTRWALRRVNRRDLMSAIFYLHPWEVDPEQPRVAGASLRSRFRHYFNLKACEARLSRLLGDFAWGRVDEIFGFSPGAGNG
jgi:polysaccharide deacetylase family protein (PEP-CTERM system associated)